MSMGSMNISITEEVYEKLKQLKRSEESFSDVITGLVEIKDIRRCFEISTGSKDELDMIEKEAMKARKGKWRQVDL